MTIPLRLDNIDPPSNRTTASSLAFTNQQLLIPLSSRFPFSLFRTDGRDVQAYDSDGTTTLATSIRNWRSAVGLRYRGRIAVPAGNAPTYGPYVQCEAVVCADLGIARPPHTAYGYATQAGRPDGYQEGGLVCLDRNGAVAFSWHSPSSDSINSLDVGDVDGDGVLELLVGTGRIEHKFHVVKASTQAASPNSSLWSFAFPAGNSYIRSAKAGKYRVDLAGNQVVVCGSQGTDSSSNGAALGKVSLLNASGSEQWTKSLNASVTNHTIQDVRVEDLDNSGSYYVYCGQSNSIYKLSVSDGSTAATYSYTTSGGTTRNFYSISVGHITSTTTRQVVGVSSFPSGSVSLGVLVVLNPDMTLAWERTFPENVYGVRCQDIDGDGYDEIIVVGGTDTGGGSGTFSPPNQGWGMLTVLDRSGVELARANLTCSAKTISYGNYDGTADKQLQVSGDDGWLTRFNVDGMGGTVKVVVPSVSAGATRTIYLGSTGSATQPPDGDAIFDFSGSDGSTPANLTARLGTWTIQGGTLQSPDDADAGNNSCTEAGYVSTDSLALEFDAVKVGQGTGTQADYYIGVRYRCSNWSSGLPDGYLALVGSKAHASLTRTASGTTTATSIYSSAATGVTFNTSDTIRVRVVVAGAWHACSIRKNSGNWIELYNVQDSSSPINTAGTVAFFNQRGQARFSGARIYKYSNADTNAGPGPVPLAYPLDPATTSRWQLNGSASSRLSGPNLPALSLWYTIATPSPSSGTVGQASGLFTASLNVPASGTVTCTPSGGGLSNPIVLTFSGASPQQFTITPTLPGTVTLVFTNSMGLPNVSPVTYAANPATALATTTKFPIATSAFQPSNTSLGYTLYRTNGQTVIPLTSAGIIQIGNLFVADIDLPLVGSYVVDWFDGVTHDAYVVAEFFVEPGLTFAQAMTAILAAATSKTTGGGLTFYAPDGVTPRLVGTVANGERTSSTLLPPT